MTSGTRQGGHPISFCTRLGGLWRSLRRDVVWVAGVTAGLLLAGQGAFAAPAGMVPYNHPVYKNGKRVLWHGTWRGHGAAAREYTRQAPAKTAPPPNPAPAAPASKEITILADPGDPQASRMAKDFAAAMTGSGTAGRAIVGSTSPSGLAKVGRADMADFAIVSLDSLVSAAKADPESMKRTPYVTRLVPETVEVIASREIKTVVDLQGRSVSFGDPDSATATSARMLFSRLGVSANPTYEPLPEALEALAAGRRDAIVVMGADDSRALDDFGDNGRFHVVAIPWSASFQPLYAPARVTSEDRPNLVKSGDAIETVGEPIRLSSPSTRLPGRRGQKPLVV